MAHLVTLGAVVFREALSHLVEPAGGTPAEKVLARHRSHAVRGAGGAACAEEDEAVAGRGDALAPRLRGLAPKDELAAALQSQG